MFSPAPGDPDRLRLHAARDLRVGDQDRPAVVGDQAAVQERQRPRDHPRLLHILHRDRAALRVRLFRVHDGARVQRRPLPRHHRDVREVLRRRAVAVVVPRHRMRVVRRRARKAVRSAELLRRRHRVAAEPTAAATQRALRPAVLAVRHQRHVDDPRVDRRQRVVHVHLERAPANRRRVDVRRVQPQVLGDFRCPAGAEHAVDARDRDARLVADVLDRFDMQLERRLRRLQVPDFIRLGGADDGRRP